MDPRRILLTRDGHGLAHKSADPFLKVFSLFTFLPKTSHHLQDGTVSLSTRFAAIIYLLISLDRVEPGKTTIKHLYYPWIVRLQRRQCYRRLRWRWYTLKSTEGSHQRYESNIRTQHTKLPPNCKLPWSSRTAGNPIKALAEGRFNENQRCPPERYP